MKQQLIILLIFMGAWNSTEAQSISFQDGANTLEIIEFKVITQPISYSDPVEAIDNEYVRLFKSYFKPNSFDTYRKFFLAADWPGSTTEDFTKWQEHLKKNRMWLDATIHAKDQYKNEYVILQYTFESNEYILPNSVVFKKVNGAWKHISLVNDSVASFLKQVGSLQSNVLSKSSRDKFHINTIIDSGNIRESKEKFDRQQLFEKIEPYFKSKNFSEQDISHAKELLLKKGEIEMVQYFAETYQLDMYVLMGELNTLFGFPLYKYTQSVKLQ